MDYFFLLEPNEDLYNISFHHYRSMLTLEYDIIIKFHKLTYDK